MIEDEPGIVDSLERGLLAIALARQAARITPSEAASRAKLGDELALPIQGLSAPIIWLKASPSTRTSPPLPPDAWRLA